jgi:hypothetical protein
VATAFQFEVTSTSSSDQSQSPAPTHFYVDFFSTGIISLTPPAVLKKHSHDSSSSTWSRRNVIHVEINDRDLLAVAIGERVPVKLFSSGRLRIKVSGRDRFKEQKNGHHLRPLILPLGFTFS